MEKNHRGAGLLRFVIVLPLLVAVLFTAWDKYEQHGYETYQKNARGEVQQRLIEIMEGLEYSLNRLLFIPLSIESFIATQDTIEPEAFYAFAERLWQHANGGLRSIQIAVGTEVRYVYPLQGNEAVVGLDLLTIEGQREALQRTIAQRQMVVAGPYNLVQGGRGVIVRQPLYHKEGGKEVFWGLATIIIDWEYLLQEGRLNGAKGLDLLLLQRPEDRIIHGNETVLLNEPVILPVTLPGSEWLLMGTPSGGWPSNAPHLYTERTIFFLFSLMLLLLVTLLLAYPRVLQRRIHEATRELEKSRNLLEQRVEERTAALAESEAQMRRLFDTAPFSIIVTAVEDGLVLYANKSAAVLFEVEGDWHKLKSSDFYVSAEDRARLVATMQRDGVLINYDVEFKTGKGGRFWCLMSAVLCEYNERPAILATHIDISKRRTIEQAHIASEANLRTIFDSVPTPMAITRRSDGRLVRINKAGVMMSGLSGVSMENFRAEDFYCDPDDRERIMAMLQQQESITEFELCMRNVSGERYTLLMSATFIEYDNEPCLLSSYAEITERKKVELALEQANREAKQAIKVKNEFLATMSHEIRTPLNGALSMVKLLGQTELNDEQREYLKAINFSGESLLQILNDVLDLSKLEAEKLELEQANFNLPRLIDEMITLMRMQHAQPDVTLDAVLDLRLPTWLRGDATRLRQVLFNLLGNALKFTERGEVTLRVDFQRERNGRIAIEFSVSDTGIGIAKDVQSRLFGDFTQADSSVARRFGGSGLGLAICRRMVELMGGQIGVDSEQGKGSRFWFTLELERGGVPEEEDQKGRVQLSSAALRVLLVEDDAINRIAGSELLRRQGCEVSVAADGYEALQRFRDSLFDVVLMDVRMPGMDGLETTRRLRELEPYGESVPVIALTADVTQENLERCRLVGMQEVLSKPIDMERLSEVLATIVPPVEA